MEANSSSQTTQDGRDGTGAGASRGSEKMTPETGGSNTQSDEGSRVVRRGNATSRNAREIIIVDDDDDDDPSVSDIPRWDIGRKTFRLINILLVHPQDPRLIPSIPLLYLQLAPSIWDIPQCKHVGDTESTAYTGIASGWYFPKLRSERKRNYTQRAKALEPAAFRLFQTHPLAEYHTENSPNKRIKVSGSRRGNRSSANSAVRYFPRWSRISRNMTAIRGPTAPLPTDHFTPPSRYSGSSDSEAVSDLSEHFASLEV